MSFKENAMKLLLEAIEMLRWSKATNQPMGKIILWEERVRMYATMEREQALFHALKLLS
jgi:hypothetical protein